MIRIKLAATFLACVISFLSTHSVADVAVIVNPNSSVSELDDKWLGAIFLGKKKKFPDGSSAVPIEQQPGTSARDKFNEKIIKKNEGQLRGYWSQLIFTGRGMAIISTGITVKENYSFKYQLDIVSEINI